MSEQSTSAELQPWPVVHCWRSRVHDPHVHVNEGPNGGCGLPEWCSGEPVPTCLAHLLHEPCPTCAAYIAGGL